MEVTKSFKIKKSFLAYIYNKFHCNFEYKIDQKELFIVKNMTIKQLFYKLDWQINNPYHIIKRKKKCSLSSWSTFYFKIQDVFYFILFHNQKPWVVEKLSQSQFLQLAIHLKV